MTLWNIIRDFFVEFVFGGTSSEGYVYSGDIGNVFNLNDLSYTYVGSSNLYLPLNGFDDMSETIVNYICFGDWLSTTATIITLVGLFIAITLLIISLFKWIVRLVSLRG